MKTYSARGFMQALMPRGEGLHAKIKMLRYIEGDKLYNKSEPLITDEVEGPEVEAGDKVIVLDYLDEVSGFWEIEYIGAVQ